MGCRTGERWRPSARRSWRIVIETTEITIVRPAPPRMNGPHSPMNAVSMFSVIQSPPTITAIRASHVAATFRRNARRVRRSAASRASRIVFLSGVPTTAVMPTSLSMCQGGDALRPRPEAFSGGQGQPPEGSWVRSSSNHFSLNSVSVPSACISPMIWSISNKRASWSGPALSIAMARFSWYSGSLIRTTG